MPHTLSYQRMHKLALLHDQLIAAGIVPLLIEGDADSIQLVVDDSVQDSAVEAIVMAHDPSLPSLSEQVASARNQDKTDLSTQFSAAVTRLTGIVQDGATYNGAQVRDGLVDTARIVRAMLKLIKDLT